MLGLVDLVRVFLNQSLDLAFVTTSTYLVLINKEINLYGNRWLYTSKQEVSCATTCTKGTRKREASFLIKSLDISLCVFHFYTVWVKLGLAGNKCVLTFVPRWSRPPQEVALRITESKHGPGLMWFSKVDPFNSNDLTQFFR